MKVLDSAGPSLNTSIKVSQLN